MQCQMDFQWTAHFQLSSAFIGPIHKHASKDLSGQYWNVQTVRLLKLLRRIIYENGSFRDFKGSSSRIIVSFIFFYEGEGEGQTSMACLL